MRGTKGREGKGKEKGGRERRGTEIREGRKGEKGSTVEGDKIGVVTYALQDPRMHMCQGFPKGFGH